ncbi:MAG: folate-binding protein [Cycloclasticus sp.]|nr:folate-binding protein [Cycloclasticus sp.]
MNTSTLYDLANDKNIISFSGTDAGSFLQGQTTCDVLNLSGSDSLFGALCNPKGRVIALFYLFKRDEIYYMVLASDMASIVIKRLKMFVFRSNVNIEDASNDYKVVGINQPLQQEVATLLTPLAQIKYRPENELALWIVPANRYATGKIHSSIIINNSINNWQILLINACIPEITNDTSEVFIPQMLNLDLLGGISLQKGCYTGQEVVARMHYKGTVKRRLVSFESEQEHISGENIHCVDDTNSVGTILSAVNTKNGASTGLVVLKTSYIQAGEIQLDDKSKLTIQTPKYDLV